MNNKQKPIKLISNSKSDTMLLSPRKQSIKFANLNLQKLRFSSLMKTCKKYSVEMEEIVQSMKNANTLMFANSNDYFIMKNLSDGAKIRSSRLQNTLRKLQKTDEIYNQENLYDYMNCIEEQPIVISKNNKSINKSKTAISLFDPNSDEKIEDEELVNLHLKKINQLTKLKGQLRLYDQKKKYSVKRTFEKYNDYPKHHFIRKKKIMKFEPFMSYNKDNIYYKRTYQSLETNQHFHSRNTKVVDSIPSTKLFSSLFNTSNLKSTCSLSIDKDRASTQRPTSTDMLSNRTYNALSLTNRKPRKKTHKTKPNLRLMKVLNNDILLENQKLKRELNDLPVRTHFKTKSNPDKISVEQITKDLKLDLVDNNNIDEDKIILTNTEKVKKNLDDKGKNLLERVVREIMYSDELLNKKYIDLNNYEKRLRYINEKNEFQKVADEMMVLKKELKAEKAVIPANEKKKLTDAIYDEYRKEWFDSSRLREKICKNQVMSHIKPLLHTVKKLFKRKLKRPASTDLI